MWKVIWFSIIEGSKERNDMEPGMAKTLFRCLSGMENIESVLLMDEDGNCVLSWGT